MYPLPTILVGFADTVALFDVRRELENASAGIEAEYADVTATCTALESSSNSKRLFILYLASAAELNHLEHLSMRFPGQPILALLEPVSDSAPVLQAMRAGAAQVVLLPLVADDFQAAVRRVSLQFAREQSESLVVAVSGVSEGCGATTVAINLAREMAALHRKSCILVELTFHMGRLACNLNVEPRFTTCDLVNDIDRLDLDGVRRALTEVAPNFSILAGPYREIVACEVSPAGVVRLLHYLRQLCDVLVMDMPYGFDSVYFDALALAHRVVLVAEQKIPSIHALRLVLDALVDKDIHAARHILINRYDPHDKGFSVKRLQELLHVVPLLTVANDYPQLLATANDGRPLRESAPECRVLADIDHLAAVVLSVPEPEHNCPSFLTRLIHHFRD